MERRFDIPAKASLAPDGKQIRGKRFTRTLLTTLCLCLLLLTSAIAHGESLDREVLAEMNLARTNPRAYADILRNFRRQFQGTRYRLPGTRTFVQTVEGLRVVDEAIAFLSSQPPQPQLGWSNGLAAAASELAREQGKSGATGHYGKKSGSMRARIERHGEWMGEIAENVGYGPEEARLMVMQFIINDGVPDRGHRKNIFHPGFGAAGVACGPHPEYGKMCAIDFADRFSENDEVSRKGQFPSTDPSPERI